MSSKKKILKNNDDDSIEQAVNATSINLNNESMDPTDEVAKNDLKIVFIPKSLHEHFECVVGKHVFIDKPWTKICHRKIIDNLQSQKSNSCFWQFRKKLEGIKIGNVLVGYKPFCDTGEEFLICITDKAKRYIEEKQTQIESEHKQKVERSLQCRVPGPWESKSSEKDIEDIKPLQTREKITYKWKLPAERLQAKAQFEDSDSKSMKNEHVKLEPRPKEIFESSDTLTVDSSVQAVRNMVNREMQTIPQIRDNKCIQSEVEGNGDLIQSQPLTKSDQALDDYLEKHVSNLVNQLPYNELCDLYREDYKLLENNNQKPTNEMPKVVNPLPGYQNVVSQKRYVSCHTWHPTMLGIFAVSYMTNSNAIYKSVSLETPTAEMIKSTVKDEKYGISYSDDENNQDSLNNQPETKLVDENYKEKIMCMLNKDFVQRMKIIQVTEDEKTNELQCSQDPSQDIIISQLRSSVIYTDQPSINSELPLMNSGNEMLIDENVITIDETLQNEDELADIYTVKNIGEKNDLNFVENEFKKNQHKSPNKEVKNGIDYTKFITTTADVIEDGNIDRVDHHDSDTESFYNIWGDDDEWLYGNKLRNVVRDIHRKFNKKYNRKVREEKLFRLLKSEAKYTERKNKTEDIDKEIMELTRDMFESGDMYQQLRRQPESKYKKKKKCLLKQNKQQCRTLQNYEESKREHNTSTMDEQNNSVIIWSISDNIFPKLRLESPEEVCCIEFNPRDGNTVVGGLTNGQICIWDINGKLETIDSVDNLNMSEKEKMHHEHLWTQMKWSLDIKFKTRIQPAALSAILKSHESAVTAIQWIHPMNEITPLGKLVTVQEGLFSDQFFSASMDGTIKLWDLRSTPLPKTNQKSQTNPHFEYPENLKKYKSPLNIYNNRLQPSYTIIIKEPKNTVNTPVTALSFEIPLIQYNCTSNQPLVIGKRQFEFVPTRPKDANCILVVGSIMGQVGVVTWNGYDTYQESSQNKEECKHIWWGHVHDGPINCIKRNVFYPDIHLVCGGHVVSIWSLNYKNGPIWWKRFGDFTNSVLWSTIHPAEFQVSFNASGVLEFWNFMKYTHRPYYTSDIFLGDGLLASLSAPHPSIHYVGNERFQFADGINQVMDRNKNELISFSDSAGTIMMITIDVMPVKITDIEEVGRVFQREVDWKRELDTWNEKYKKRFGSSSEKIVDDYKPTKNQQVLASISTEDDRQTATTEQNKRQICDETFKWYFNNIKARLDKTDVEYMEREKLHMVEALMKKKKVDEKELREYLKEIEVEKFNEDEIQIKIEDDETYTEIVNKLLFGENTTEEYVFDVNSKSSTDSDDIKTTFEKIHQLLVTNIVTEKEKLSDYIKKNPYEVEQEDWSLAIEFAEREVRDRLNDPTLLKSPTLRMMRRKLAKTYIDEGYTIKEWKSREEMHTDDLYKIRERNIVQLKTAYGDSYDPYWDKGLRPQTMSEAIRTRRTEAVDEDCGQQFGDYFRGKGKDDECYADYLTLLDSTSSYPYTGCERLSKREEEATAESDDLDIKPSDLAESFERELPNGRNKQTNEYDVYRVLETLDEHVQVEENSVSTTSNELNENNIIIHNS